MQCTDSNIYNYYDDDSQEKYLCMHVYAHERSHFYSILSAVNNLIAKIIFQHINMQASAALRHRGE